MAQENKENELAVEDNVRQQEENMEGGKKSGKEKKELLSLVEFPLIMVNFDADGNIVASVSLSDYMIKENYDKLKPYLKQRIVYRWNGKKYEREA